MGAKNEKIQTFTSTGDLQGIRPEMEDCHVITTLAKHSHILFAAVYDGHGGKGAAQFLSKNLHPTIDSGLGPDEHCLVTTGPAAVWTAHLGVDERFLDKNSPHLISAGSTSVIAMLNKVDRTLVVANLGDARSVMSRRGIPVPLVEIHKPHYPRERERIALAGHHVLRGRLDGSLAVSRAIGDRRFKFRPLDLPPSTLTPVEANKLYSMLQQPVPAPLQPAPLQPAPLQSAPERQASPPVPQATPAVPATNSVISSGNGQPSSVSSSLASAPAQPASGAAIDGAASSPAVLQSSGPASSSTTLATETVPTSGSKRVPSSDEEEFDADSVHEEKTVPPTAAEGPTGASAVNDDTLLPVQMMRSVSDGAAVPVSPVDLSIRTGTHHHQSSSGELFTATQPVSLPKRGNQMRNKRSLSDDNLIEQIHQSHIRPHASHARHHPGHNHTASSLFLPTTPRHDKLPVFSPPPPQKVSEPPAPRTSSLLDKASIVPAPVSAPPVPLQPSLSSQSQPSSITDQNGSGSTPMKRLSSTVVTVSPVVNSSVPEPVVRNNSTDVALPSNWRCKHVPNSYFTDKNVEDISQMPATLAYMLPPLQQIAYAQAQAQGRSAEAKREAKDPQEVQEMDEVQKSIKQFEFEWLGKASANPSTRACTAAPAIRQMQIQPGDEFLLLACDGLFDVMDEREVVQWVRRRFKKRTINIRVPRKSASTPITPATAPASTSGSAGANGVPAPESPEETVGVLNARKVDPVLANLRDSTSTPMTPPAPVSYLAHNAASKTLESRPLVSNTESLPSSSTSAPNTPLIGESGAGPALSDLSLTPAEPSSANNMPKKRSIFSFGRRPKDPQAKDKKSRSSVQVPRSATSPRSPLHHQMSKDDLDVASKPPLPLPLMARATSGTTTPPIAPSTASKGRLRAKVPKPVSRDNKKTEESEEEYEMKSLTIIDPKQPMEGCSIKTIARELCEYAIGKGSTDNVTILIVFLDFPVTYGTSQTGSNT